MLKLFAERKWAALTLAAAFFITLFALAAWRFYSVIRDSSESAAETVIRFGYCGAELDELCVLSFGRDAEGYTLVNFFVPDEDFPDFYLKIVRAVGESIYECERDKEFSGGVSCAGDALNLNEQLDITVLANEDDRLLGSGRFMVKAVLISYSDGVLGQLQPQPLSTDGSALDTTPTPTIAITPAGSALPSTPTPAVGYPNP